MNKKNLLNKYLKHLDISTNIKTLQDVNLLINEHLKSLSFTNIPILCNASISLELEDIVDKLVMNKRGGYCFEHNKLMYEILKEFGFDVKAVAGRVLNNKEIEVPKTHRLTILTYENEKYLVDVGFGFASPRMLVKFGDTPSKTFFASYLIKKIKGDIYALGILKEEGFYTLYTFDIQDYHEADFEMGNFYSYRHTKANFVNNFVISCITENKIKSLRNGNFQKIYKDKTIQREIKSATELEGILKDEFSYPITQDEIELIYEKFVSF